MCLCVSAWAVCSKMGPDLSTRGSASAEEYQGLVCWRICRSSGISHFQMIQTSLDTKRFIFGGCCRGQNAILGKQTFPFPRQSFAPSPSPHAWLGYKYCRDNAAVGIHDNLALEVLLLLLVKTPSARSCFLLLPSGAEREQTVWQERSQSERQDRGEYPEIVSL